MNANELSREDRDTWSLQLHDWYEKRLGLSGGDLDASDQLMSVLDDQFEQFHEQVVTEMEDYMENREGDV